MTAPVRSPEDRAKYLARQLRANPIETSGDIVRLRGRFFGLKTAPEAAGGRDPDDAREAREFIVDRLDEIRRDFWGLRLARIKSVLKSLNLEPYPDLKRAADRLLVVAVHRPEFGPLSERRGFDAPFFDCLKNVLVLPAREAAAQRERAVRMTSRPRQSKRVKRMIRAIESEMPAVYELEADWFDTLARSRPDKSNNSSSRGSDSDESFFSNIGCLWWIIGLAVLGGVLRLME